MGIKMIKMILMLIAGLFGSKAPVNNIDVTKYYKKMVYDYVTLNYLDLSEAKAKGLDLSDIDKFVIIEKNESKKIFELPRLMLSLSNNNLTIFPEYISKLKYLVGLDLSKNQLTTLPESILLDLSSKPLIPSPEHIGLTLSKSDDYHLTYSECIARQMNIISIKQGKYLLMLDLSNNQLTTLPESIGNLKTLWFLNLSNNQLTTLPESLSKLVWLFSLNIANNKLESLPTFIRNFRNLKFIDIEIPKDL